MIERNIVVTCLRHAIAELVNGQVADKDRLLSEQGIRQARERRLKLGNPQFALVLHSPVRRAKQTALIIADMTDSDQRLVAIPQICLPPKPENQQQAQEKAAIDESFQALGNCALRNYLGPTQSANSLRGFVRRSIFYLEERMGAAELADSDRMLIIGHAVLLPALGHEWLMIHSHPTLALRMLDVVLNETQGFEIEFCCRQAVSLELIAD